MNYFVSQSLIKWKNKNLKLKENFGEISYEIGEIPPRNTFFSGSCVLVNAERNHRVLIRKSNDGTFSLFSCYFKEETFCPYEVNKWFLLWLAP